jgi:hypothetical protein
MTQYTNNPNTANQLTKKCQKQQQHSNHSCEKTRDRVRPQKKAESRRRSEAQTHLMRANCGKHRIRTLSHWLNAMVDKCQFNRQLSRAPLREQRQEK